MVEARSDILVNIPDDQLPKLATLYETKATWAPYMVSFVHMGIRWKKLEKYRDVITFMSPNNSWEEDGTIVAILQSSRHDLVVFTLDDQCTNLYEGLMKTNLIDYRKRVMFFNLHEKHIPAVMKYIEDKKLNISEDTPCFIYAMSPEDAKKLTIECPPDIYVDKLELSMTKQVNTAWPHRFEGSENYVSTFIETNGGYGVFLKATNELVAWGLNHTLGHLGLLQTAERHKKKGYGSLIARVLSKEIGEGGHWPVGTVLVDNKVSMKMFEKMGFRNIGICTFITIENTAKLPT
ncbi:FR47 and/or Acetyltransf 1 domain containing protein, partial [Asbolus verrucosus]